MILITLEDLEVPLRDYFFLIFVITEMIESGGVSYAILC